MREQPFEHADRGVERPADRAVLDLAVPAAVLELLIDQAIDHALDVLPEVGAETDDHAIDARLDLALEERLAGVLPAAVVPDQPHGSADAFVLGIHAVLLQLHEAVRGRGPRLAIVGPREAAARHARGTARRLPTGRRRPAMPGAARPSPRWRPCALGFDNVRRRITQVAQGLPADRRVGFEQPLQRCHARSLATRPNRPEYRRVDDRS